MSADTTTAPQAPQAPQAPLCDILIADDSGQCRDILRALLRTFTDSLTIREVRNGQEAVQACLALHPRVTFLDIDMPEVDGLAALQQIRDKRDDAFIAIVSGRSSADNVRRALTTGANGFVVKPYKPQRILDVLERYQAKTGHKWIVPR